MVHFAGLQVRCRIALLDRLNVPSAVIGGLMFATLVPLVGAFLIDFPNALIITFFLNGLA